MTFIHRTKAILINATQATNDIPIFRSTTTSLDASLRRLPRSQATAVKVPTSQAKSRAFFARLANLNAARVAAGGVAMVLVLIHADSAQAQAATTSVAGMEGVASVAVRADGTALVTLENGATMVMPAGSFIQTANGEILVTDGVASQIMAAADGAAAAAIPAAAIAAPAGLLAAIGAAGGGGSDGSGGASGPTTSSGRVIDGYLVDATVFRDLNDNGDLDSGEPNTKTDDLGNWTLELDPSNADAKLISFGGTDISTGKPFTGVLTAPAGSTVVTPLTTLVQSYVESQAAAGTTVSTSDASARLAKALGLEGQNLLTLDPVEAIEGDDGSADAFKAAAQVASVINAASAATGGDEAQSKAVASSLADKLLAAEEASAGSGKATLSDKTTIDDALTAGGVDADKVSQIGSQLVAANDIIANSTGETAASVQEEIIKVQEVVQGQLVDAIKNDDGSLETLNVEDAVEAIVALRPVVNDPSATVGATAIADGLEVSGTGRPGSTVEVSIDGVVKSVVVVAGEGSGAADWTVTFAATDLPDTDGEFAIQTRAKAADATAFTAPVRSGTLTVDVSVADVVLNGIPTDPVPLVDQVDGTTITGTTDANASVRVTLGEAELTVSADASGAFSAFFSGVTPAVATNGQASVTVKAVATDLLGNVSDETTAAIPLQPLSALTPTVNPVPGVVNAADAADGLTLGGTGIAGSVVTVTAVNGGTQFSGDVPVATDGTWSVSVPAGANLLTVPGTYTVTAVATIEDVLTSASASGGSITIDLDGPAADGPLINPVAGDDVLDAIEAQEDLVVTGTAAANATVTVMLGEISATDVVGSDGVFSVTFSAAQIAGLEGAASISAFSTDDLDNVSATTTRSFTATAPIVGSAGVDRLTGTDGNDLFLLRTEGYVKGSAGDDTYDFSDPDIFYHEIDYSGLSEGLTAAINMNDGTASRVVKGSLGTDTLIEVDDPGYEGFGIVTTAQDDTVTVVQNTSDYSWTGIYYKGGDDTYDITLGNGITRLSFAGTNPVAADLNLQSATVDLEDATAGTVAFTLSGPSGSNGTIELEGSNGDDVLLGSGTNDRFIGRGGNDTIDGRDGFDLARYDRNQIGDSGVFVTISDAGGTALGVWNGDAFKHELENIEHVRGSKGNDLLSANDGGYFLDGNDGNDTLVGEEGDDSFRGGAGADVFIPGGGSNFIDDFQIGTDFLSDTDDVFGGPLGTEWSFFDDDAGNAVMQATNGPNRITFGGSVTAAELEGEFNAGRLFYQAPVPTNDITGGANEDEILTGTAGNDYIEAVGRTDGNFGYDVITGSDGFDVFDIFGLGERDYVELDYSGQSQNGIVGDISFNGEDESSALIWKLGGGFDRILNPGAAGDGIGIIGTAFNDDLFIALDNIYHWVGFSHSGGDDRVTIERNGGGGQFVYGTFRASIGNDDANVTADLEDGILVTSSGGSLVIVTDEGTSSDNGTRPMLEVRTFNGDDDVKGSASGDRFILGAGDDSVDGRGGNDLVRYDRAEISGAVTANLATGTASGTWAGAAFTHTLTSIEGLRGSAGNDGFTGNNADNILDGRNGNDTLTGGEGNDSLFGGSGDDVLVGDGGMDQLSGGDGDDRMTGGAEADLFLLSNGHDVITDFDVERDDIDDGGSGQGDEDFSRQEIIFENVTSTKISFGTDGASSLTLKGIDLASFQQWLIVDEFGPIVTPAGLDNPITVSVLNNALDEIDPFLDPSLVSATANRVEFTTSIGGSNYNVIFVGENFGFDGADFNQGTVDTMTVTKDGVPSITLTNVGMEVPAVIDAVVDGGTAARDVYMIGTDNPDQLGFSAQKVWIEGKGGDDQIETSGNGDVSVAGGDGSDMILINQGLASAQSFIFIDPVDSGVDMIDGFRLSGTEELGDRLVVVGGGDARSHYYFNTADLSDTAALEAQLSGIGGSLGADANVALFIDSSNNGSLYQVDTSGGGTALGQELAVFQNIDTSIFDSNVNYDHIVRFAEEVPQLPAMA